MQKGMPFYLLRGEGLAAFILAAVLYRTVGGPWLLFILLLLVPDLSALGYLAGNRVGAVTYNVIHTYVTPLVLAATGFLCRQPVLTQGALIWVAHIGMDRMLGYGLKYETGFKDTHLNRT
ncbi:MAG TPA: DUF4260 domain-containing protein [Symbiobacteriaceae bacterium]|jgi:hypothetical protein